MRLTWNNHSKFIRNQRSFNLPLIYNCRAPSWKLYDSVYKTRSSRLLTGFIRLNYLVFWPLDDFLFGTVNIRWNNANSKCSTRWRRCFELLYSSKPTVKCVMWTLKCLLCVVPLSFQFRLEWQLICYNCLVICSFGRKIFRFCKFISISLSSSFLLFH